MDYLNERAALLRIKECDLRLDALLQCETSVDMGIHIGGAYSAITPLAALYYGGMMHYNVSNPTDTDQDLFILSKGHAVAALASVYADIGYIGRSSLEHSRGYGAVIKGHPGPIIPGVPVATGPLGHGISIACGYAMKRRETNGRNVYCMVGDGELQEGSCWEGILLAADRNLSNLCVIVDKNNGQSDDTKKLIVGMDDIAERFRGFGYRVLDAHAEDMEGILSALETFCAKPQGAAPTAIICHSSKGFGGFSAVMGLHKANLDAGVIAYERACLGRRRETLVSSLREHDMRVIDALAKEAGLCVRRDASAKIVACERVNMNGAPKKAEPRDKSLKYPAALLPPLERDRKYATYQVAKSAMAAFAHDARLYTVDSDLSNASGLQPGAGGVNARHAINVGIAECNMMCVAEALASEGACVFVSTFTPFFDMRAFRRIAVSYQEREEAILDKDGWLNAGHNLDITFLATSANLDTAVNGATHMGNDDICLVDQLAHVKVIDAGCPQLLQSVLKWIAEGNRGLVYLRTMKDGALPLYPADFRFEYGKGYYLHKAENPAAAVLSSGHGVYEAMKAKDILQTAGVAVDVVDMPSFDGELCRELAGKGIPLLFAEQNNGALFNRFSRFAIRNGIICQAGTVLSLNTLGQNGLPQYIQSGTYQQLIEALGLTPDSIASKIMEAIKR